MAQNFIIGKMFTLGQKMLEAINKKQHALFVWKQILFGKSYYIYYSDLCLLDMSDMYTYTMP